MLTGSTITNLGTRTPQVTTVFRKSIKTCCWWRERNLIDRNRARWQLCSDRVYTRSLAIDWPPGGPPAKHLPGCADRKLATGGGAAAREGVNYRVQP